MIIATAIGGVLIAIAAFIFRRRPQDRRRREHAARADERRRIREREWEEMRRKG